MSKNAILITSPRCGSTTFLQNIVTANTGMHNWGENLRTLGHGYEPFPKIDAQRKAQFKQVMRAWNDPTQSNCVKVFPLMLREQLSPWRKETFLQDLMSEADECYYLLRRDLEAQVKSAVVAFYKTMQGDVNFHSNWEEPLVIPDNDQTRKLVRTCERQMYASNVEVVHIWKNTPHSWLRSEHKKEIIWLEDRDQSQKYNRPVEFEKEPEIDGNDWELLFS